MSSWPGRPARDWSAARRPGNLTGLFYEARFSGHELTAAQRDAARDALEQLAADLRGSP